MKKWFQLRGQVKLGWVGWQEWGIISNPILRLDNSRVNLISRVDDYFTVSCAKFVSNMCMRCHHGSVELRDEEIGSIVVLSWVLL